MVFRREAGFGRLEDAPWHEPITRVAFRRIGESAIAVNVLLPDVIFAYDDLGQRAGLVPTFTYEARINLLSQSREFARLVVGAIIESLLLLSRHRTPVYTWQRRTN